MHKNVKHFSVDFRVLLENLNKKIRVIMDLKYAKEVAWVHFRHILVVVV